MCRSFAAVDLTCYSKFAVYWALLPTTGGHYQVLNLHAKQQIKQISSSIHDGSQMLVFFSSC
jgi:hypothetical protein